MDSSPQAVNARIIAPTAVQAYSKVDFNSGNPLKGPDVLALCVVVVCSRLGQASLRNVRPGGLSGQADMRWGV